MTQAQRKKHIAAINAEIEAQGFEVNRYGIYHKDEYKIDTRPTNIKISKGDYKKLSVPISGVMPEEVKDYIRRMLS